LLSTDENENNETEERVDEEGNDRNCKTKNKMSNASGNVRVNNSNRFGEDFGGQPDEGEEDLPVVVQQNRPSQSAILNRQTDEESVQQAPDTTKATRQRYQARNR